MNERIFGTDGIRGRAGSGWLTPAGALRIGRSVGRVLGQPANLSARRALLGHDGRASGPELAAAVARGLRAAGFEPVSAGLLPTPGIAWLAREHAYGAAVMISASHNPAADNGIKIFGPGGEKLSEAQELAIEADLPQRASSVSVPLVPDDAALREDDTLARAYETRLCDYGADFDLRGCSIAFDGANGAGSRVGPRVLERLGARVHVLACAPDGNNINAACGAVHPEQLRALALARRASIGIALDGDGDRCILVDERGATVDGDAILTVVARHAMTRAELRPARIAATVMSNRGLHRALREVGVSVVDTDVGDRKVVEAMRRESLMLGGEQSGHIVFGAANHWIGDGLYTALSVLRVLCESGRPLSELAAPYRTFPQLLKNVKVRAKPPLLELPGLAEALAEVERALAPDGRVLLRYSGTESLARVMVEGPDERAIGAHVERLCELVRAAIGA